MTISHDTDTRFPLTDGPSGTNSVDTTTGDRVFSHAGSASAKGAVVVLHCTGTTSTVTGVLYGGVAMTLTTSATDTSEAGRVEVWTLTDQESFPTGTVDVTLQGCTATGKWATCSTVVCSVGERAKVNASNLKSTTTAANPTLNVVTTATTMLYGGMHGGAASPGSYVVGSGYTSQYNNDYGALSARSSRRTAEVAAGTIVYNFAYATSDDYCIAAVALKEYTPGDEPPAYVSQGGHFRNSTSTPAIDVPTGGVPVGDIVVVYFNCFDNDGTSTITSRPSGFAAATGSPMHATTSTSHVEWKRVTGTADLDNGTYDFTMSGSVYVDAWAVRYSGVIDSGDPWDDTDAAVGGTGTTAPDVAVTTTDDQRLLCYFCGYPRGDEGTWTHPSGFTGRAGTTNDSNVGVSDKVQVSAGGSGNVHASHTVSQSNIWASWLGALKPPGGGTTPVSSDLDVRWTTRGRINSDHDLRWQTSTLVSSDLDVRWQTLVSVSSDLDLRWQTSVLVSSDVDVRWQTLAAVNSDLDLRWATVGAPSTISSDLDIRWQTSILVSSDLDVRWRTLAAVTSDLDVRWVTLGAPGTVSSDLGLRWRTLTALSSDLDLRWRTSILVDSDHDVRWRTLAAVSSDLDVRWAVLAALDSDLDVRWRTAVLISSDHDLRWAVLAALDSDLDLRWITYAQVTSDLDVRWVTVSEALTTGEVFGTAAVSVGEAPWDDNPWNTPGNVFADDAATANVT